MSVYVRTENDGRYSVAYRASNKPVNSDRYTDRKEALYEAMKRNGNA